MITDAPELVAANNSDSCHQNPVSILLTVRELDHGGIERDVTKIALTLDQSRFEPHVASYRSGGMRFEELKHAGIPFLHLPVSSLKSASVLSAAIRLWRYIRKHSIRLIHAYDPTAVFVVPIAKALRVPAVLSSTLGYRELLDPRTRRQVRLTDKFVDAVVVNCEAMRRHMTEDERISSHRIELCYNGVDTRQFYPQAVGKPEPVAEASFLIGTVCVLRPEKALDLLQEAFARVRLLKPGMKLLLVGSGPDLPRLVANAERLGLQNDCKFVPATSLVANFLRALDIFVVTSRSEAFSNALLEAMACGCCVIGSRVGGIPELIANEESGLLFQPGNTDDLVAKLTALIQDESRRRAFGARAAEVARTKFSIEIAAQRMASIYESILRRKAIL